MSEELYLINIYDVYGQCVDGGEGKIADERYSKFGIHNLGATERGPTWCSDSIAASNYFNRDDVIEAIHVKKQDFRWDVCAQDERFTYQYIRPNLPRDTYPLLNENIRVI